MTESAEAAEAFAHATRMHAELAAMHEKDVAERDSRELLRKLTREIPKEASARVRPAPVYRRAVFQSVTAAVLLLWLGIFIYWSVAQTTGTSMAAYEVKQGQAFIQGRSATKLRDGEVFRVGSQSPVLIQMADGSEVELEPACRATLHREGDANQVVRVLEGGGVFRVVKGGHSFQVKTSVGDVRVLGTEFSVRLMPSGDKSSPAKSANVMAVGVISGSVQVDVNSKSYTLGRGATKLFDKNGERQAVPGKITGTIVSVRATCLSCRMPRMAVVGTNLRWPPIWKS